eukprot:CAMPEP_0116124778 /NCGR_PEP_ID=MMETSP0329-20121206/5460_1 /TAXON_ID=697910 /ORGANISM="Pseudo-nitzschia arenysensis, Strain B593" /LENGTH=1205 /DNA_ID=CAMNT_0003618777 /DNA_START=244 /DNA_END=3858 /DNA_ORIENTATION=-
MEPSNYYDSNDSSSQRPQHTHFLDLTNGEGGERIQGVAMPYRDDGYMPSNSAGNINRSIAAPISSLRTSSSFPRGGGGDDTAGFGGKLDANTPGRLVETGQEQTGRWTKEEHEAFLKGLKLYGKEWKKVAAKVKTRTVVQTRTHAQKYFQKLAKANEGKDDITQVDMGTASEARRGASALKKKRTAVSTSNKIARTASVASAAQVITTLGQHPLPLGRPLEVSSQNHGFQTAAGNGHKVMTAISSKDHSMYQPTHGFSSSFANTSVSEARPQSISSAAVNDVMMGGNKFLRGKPSAIGTSSFPSMKIVAPAHDSAIKQGKFPEPSPAACGKRKLAEIAAARMLAGVAASETLLTPSQSQSHDGIKRTAASLSRRGPNHLGNIEDGTATPPPEERHAISQAFQTQKPQGTISMAGNAVSSLTGGPRNTMGLSLQIVNPESLGVSREGIVGRKKHGQNSPVTPWEGQLQALVSEEKLKGPSKDVSAGGLPKVPSIGARDITSSSSIHPICGPSSGFGRSLLHKAVCDMDMPAVQSQLLSRPDYCDRRDYKDYCPIHSACALCMKDIKNSFLACEIVRMLITSGADASIRDPEGNTPLHWAARAGDKATAQLLLVNHNPKDAKNERGETPLHWALRSGRVGISVASSLIENGARPSVWNIQFKRPIDVAADGFFDEPDPVMSIRALDEKKKKLKKEHRQKLKNAAIERKEARANLFNCSAQSRTLVLYHPECLEHIPKAEGDWENPTRIKSIMERIQTSHTDSGTPSIYPREIQVSKEFERASLDLLSRVHSTEYLRFVNELSKDLERQQKEQNARDGNNENSSGAPPVVPFTPMVQRSMTKVIDSSSVKLGEHSDTSFSAGSLRAARRAAGAVQHAVDCVLVGRHRNAFCVVRPPGHHAGINGLLDGGESCGFCIFNSVAAGAMHAISDERLMCERCAIVDFDAHHGNGTEEIVRKCHDPGKLFFFSIHLYDNDRKGKRETKSFQYKFYPGTGDEDDLPLNIINVPVAPLWKEGNQVPVGGTHNTRHRTRNRANQSDDGSSSEAGTPRVSDAEVESRLPRSSSPTPTSSRGAGGRQAYRRAIQDRLLPSLRAFNPDLILISAGFDACKGDVGNAKHEIGGKEKMGIDLEPEDYAWTTSKILEIADICCQGRVVSVLEGGYGRHIVSGGHDTSDQRLDKSLFSECAIRHAHAMIDPYNVEGRFGTSRK